MSVLTTIPTVKRDHMKGRTKAPVLLLLYGDYECPFCGKAYYVIQKLLQEKPNLICYSFRNFPLIDVHPHALSAAMAAEAAGLQKKFWEMHAALFENQSLLDEDYILAYANEADLDMARFLKDIESPAVEKRIQEDIDSGVEAGVNGTPAFFINGEPYDGPYDYGILSQVIDTVATNKPYKSVEYDHGLSHSKK
jgi:protein-disulfide isomerase